MHHKQIIIRAAIAVAWSGFCLHTYVSDTSTVSSSSFTLDDGKLNLRRQLSRNKDKRRPVPDDKESISIDADGTDSLLTIPPMAAGKEQDAANEPNNVDPDAWTDAATKYYDTVDSMIKNGEEEEDKEVTTTVSIYLAVGAAVSRGRGNKLIPQLSHSFLNTGMIERLVQDVSSMIYILQLHSPKIAIVQAKVVCIRRSYEKLVSHVWQQVTY